MSDELFFACQAREVVADHLERPLGRFASGPKIDQEASDDRAVALNFNAVLVVADQMGAAQELFEETEKYFESGVTSIRVGT